MRASKKVSSVLFLLAAAVVAALVAGCGGGSSSGGGGGEPAQLAPEDAPLFVEANLAPEKDESEALNEVVNTFSGIENIGEYITEELEKAALGEGEKFDYSEEVEPWLGEKVGISLNEFDGENFTGAVIAVESSNSGETEEFVEERVEKGDAKSEEGEFEGVKYYVTEEPGEEPSTLGVVGDYFVIAESTPLFKETVTLEKEGKGGLSESKKFTEAMEAAEDQGIAHLYVDIGGLIEKAGSAIPPETEAFLALTGIEPREATLVAGVVPHSEQIEMDVSTNVTKASSMATGDASAMLEGLPATAVLGFATPEFGKSFGESLKELNKQGIPGQVEPNQLLPALETMGINLEQIADSFGDVGGFLEGSSQANLGGAVVLEAKNATEAKNTVSNLGLLLRASQTPGVTALSGKLSGFSVTSPELGANPIIVAASGEKLVIAYGMKAAGQALRAQAKTLGSTPDYEAAKEALGSTPMAFFVDGAPMLKLVGQLLSPEEQAEFQEAEPILEKISYIGAGEETKGAATTAKIIFGLQK
jgi:hypothetical protein